MGVDEASHLMDQLILVCCRNHLSSSASSSTLKISPQRASVQRSLAADLSDLTKSIKLPC